MSGVRWDNMIRKSLIVVLTLGALGTLTARAMTHHPEWAGGWQLRSSSWLGNRIVVHHRYIIFAHDKVLPGQIADPEFGERTSALFKEAEEAGKLTSSKGVMEDSFADSRLLSVRWGRGQYLDEFAMRTHRSVVCLPLWMPLLVFATYPIIAFIRGPFRRWRRRKRGLCIRCGYNLEGNVSGVCPECGEAK